jgi:hypothetical protein
MEIDMGAELSCRVPEFTSSYMNYMKYLNKLAALDIEILIKCV